MKTSARPALVAQDLKCGYADHLVLSGVNFSIAAGEVVALIGPNGSGKSTLISTLGGVIRFIGGRFQVLGEDSVNLRPDEWARRVATVPQKESPAFDFTAREMVLMARIPHSHGLFETEHDHEVADRALNQVEAMPLADRPFAKLSGGEQQRVLLARALAQESPILLLDEPSAHLDLHFQKEFVEIVRTLSRELGKTIVAAVHDLNLAAAISDRLLLIHQGSIRYDGEAGPLLESGQLQSVFGVELIAHQTSDGYTGVITRY